MTAPASRLARIALGLALLGALAVPVDLVLHGRARTGALGLPFDDAWVHLSYARTLAERGAYAHSPGAPAASGAMAPLLVALEAPFVRLVPAGKPLAIAVSIAAWAAFLLAFAGWASRRLGGPAWAAAAVALVGLDPRLTTLAASGTETSLFLAASALAFQQRIAGRPLGAALALGAALLARPEGLLLAALFALDALLPGAPTVPKPRHPAPRDARPALCFGAIALGYGLLHWTHGQSLIPTAFTAVATLARGTTLAAYARDSILPAFLTAAWLPILPFFAVAAGVEAGRAFRTRAGVVRLEVLWVLALATMLAIAAPARLPLQRDLMLALPAAVIAALAGVRALLGLRALAAPASALRGAVAGTRGLVAAAAAVIALAGFAVPRSATQYEELVRRTQERHEAVGRWLATNTPAAAVVATHEPGAIGFHSRRRIVDTVGRLTPEILPVVGTITYPARLERLFAERGVTHVAATEAWLPVDNVAALHESAVATEVVRVHPWRPGVSHVVHGRAWGEAAFATAAIQRGDNDLAIASLARAVRVDPKSAQIWNLLGIALGNADRAAEAEDAFRRAVMLYPEWPDPRDGLVSALIAQDKPFRMSEIERLGYPDSVTAPAVPPAAAGR